MDVALIKNVNTVKVETLQQRLTINQHIHGEPLDLLHRQCSLSARVDAKERLNPPCCAQETRQTILQDLEDWISSSDDSREAASLFWLNGGAGVGKSALAQTLAVKFQRNDSLAAAFFFFKSDDSRNNGDQLIPTLVSQLILKAFKEMTPFVEESLRRNRDLFAQNLENQISKLLIEPLIRLSLQDFDKKQPMAPLKSRLRLIVIDGLDECKDPQIQCELLRLIAGATPHLPYPFRFLITSRPEPHILQTFSELHSDQVVKVHQYNLSDDPAANDDISRYLRQAFQNIRRVHHLRQYLTPDWPSEVAIKSLVERSSSHFIYASTVVRYIESRDDRPDKRLGVVLGLSQRRDNAQPYSQLDDLFRLILQSVEDTLRLKQLICAFGIMYLRSQRSGGLFDDYWSSYRDAIEELFDIDPVSFFDRLRSLVAIDQDIRNLHKSLFDYLLDSSRSGDLCIDFPVVHQTVANYLLTKKIETNLCKMDEFRHFAYHCQFASLTDKLRRHLIQCSAEVPLQLHLPQNLDHSCESIALSVFYIFRTLGRKDFAIDRCYYKYAKNIEKHVDMGVTWLQQIQFALSGIGTNPRSEEIALRSLLRSWKPQISNLPKDEEKRKRVARISKEHNLLSSYIQVSSRDKIALASISNKHFIHNYHYAIHAESPRFLLLFTYAKNNDVVSWSTLGAKDLLAKGKDAGTILLDRAKEHLEQFEKVLRQEVQDSSCSYNSSRFGCFMN